LIDFQAWPKAELHVHLDGCLRPQTVWELARSTRFSLPFSSQPELEQHLRMPRRCTLPAYLEAFTYTVGVMQEREPIQRVAFEFVEDIAQDGVDYVEVRFAPSLHRQKGLSMEQVIEAVVEGLKQGSQATGTVAKLICCAMRQEAPSLSEAVAQVAAEYQRAGVVALDLAGPEDGFPAEAHRAAFEHALNRGLHLTIHAGESCCPEMSPGPSRWGPNASATAPSPAAILKLSNCWWKRGCLWKSAPPATYRFRALSTSMPSTPFTVI